jgi:spermidine/putrescine transport system ATP-binding protein
VARFIGETNLFDASVISVEKLGGPQLSSTASPPALSKKDSLSADDGPIGVLVENLYMAELHIPELGKIKVTTDDEIKPGQKVSFTIRPEKIVISKEMPAIKRSDINLVKGEVDEPIYSGFQTKFYVQVNERSVIRVIKQHANYYDEGPDIVWKDRVYLSWSANDGYIVGINNPGDPDGSGDKKSAGENGL